jgi:hypothetical protein
VSGVDLTRPLEGKSPHPLLSLTCAWFKHVEDMVACIDSFDDRTCEPGWTVLEHRHAAGALRPPAPRELVNLVAGGPAEEACELPLRSGDNVNCHELGPLRHLEGPVLLREADQETEGIDAALGGETHETPRHLAFRSDRDYEHRIVQHTDDLLEVRQGLSLLGTQPSMKDKSTGPSGLLATDSARVSAWPIGSAIAGTLVTRWRAGFESTQADRM